MTMNYYRLLRMTIHSHESNYHSTLCSVLFVSCSLIITQHFALCSSCHALCTLRNYRSSTIFFVSVKACPDPTDELFTVSL